MPSIIGSESVSYSPLPVRPKLLRRFYEPIFLEAALIKLRRQGFLAPRRTSNSAPDETDNVEQAFKCFVNRLAQVCDNHRAGTTVSAIAVLEEADCAHYILGSNNRKSSEFLEVQEFLTDLLGLAGRSQSVSGGGFKTVKKAMFRQVLLFNSERVKAYLGYMVQHLDECLADYERKGCGDNAAAVDFKRVLIRLKQMAEFSQSSNLDEVTFVNSCHSLFRWIDQAQRSKFADRVSEQARDGEMNRSEPWIELRHFVGRLHSYHLAVETIVRTSQRLSRLFHEFKVTIIPSAALGLNPLKNRRLNAHDIIGRMVWPPEEAVGYQAQAKVLQQFDLDEAIQDQCNNESPTHSVHAEVLLLDYILAYLERGDAIGFWNGYRYIGTGKGPCRMCHYWFTEHPSGVQVRPSHGNLYVQWRVPDAFDDTAAQAREFLMNSIVKKIRADALRSIQIQMPACRPHDSTSFSELPPHLVSGQTDTASVSDDISVLEIMGMKHTKTATEQIPTIVEEVSIVEEVNEDTWSTTGQAEESDDEGGVKL